MAPKAKKVVTFGEVMMRLSPPDKLRFRQTTTYEAIYGGGECNVSIALANLGLPTAFVTRFPDHEIGWSAVDYIRKFGVDTSNIILGGDRLGVYYLEHGAVSRPSKIIYDRWNSSFADIQPEMIDWENVFKDAEWFHWTGITPAVSQGAMETCLVGVKKAKEMGLYVSGDPGYRSGLWQYEVDPAVVLRELLSYSDLVIANDYDSELLLGSKISQSQTDNELKTGVFTTFADQLIDRYPSVKVVSTTRRNSISASHNQLTGLSYVGKNITVSKTYDITHIVDRVGGGDAFMGGLIYGMISFPDDHAGALDFAVACSTLKHTIWGDAAYVSLNDVLDLMEGDGSGRVVR